MAVSRSKVKKQETQGNLDPAREALMRASGDVSRLPWVSCFFTLLRLTAITPSPNLPMSGSGGVPHKPIPPHSSTTLPRRRR